MTKQIVYIIRRITEDGLVKLPDGMSEWIQFETQEDALEYADQYDHSEVVILTKIVTVWE